MLKIIFYCCLLFFLAIFVAPSHTLPQSQPRWNWEEVILSRNGPSTSTTPRPKTWTTTTLRSFDVPAVKGEGSIGTFEDASIVPRSRYHQPGAVSDSGVPCLPPLTGMYLAVFSIVHMLVI